MKQFYLLTKTLLVVVCLLVGGVNSVWGQITETYDFESWGKAHMSKANNSDINGHAVMGTEPAGFSVNGTAMNQLHVTSNKNTDFWDMGSRFAVSPAVTFRWGKGSSDVPRLGTENASGTFYISIFGLDAGDVVTFTIGGTITFYSSNATYDVSGTPTAVVAGTTTITGGTAYTITGSGAQRLDLTMTQGWNHITKIVITRNPYKSWNFRSLSPSWSKDGGFGSSTININGRTCTYTTGSLEGMALDNSNTDWGANGNGLFEGNGNRSFAVLDLKANDKVVIETSTTLSNLVNATSINDTYTGTCEFRVTADGAIGFTTTRWANSTGAITSLKVYHEYVSSPLFSKGRYYLKNKSTGAYFAGGKNWGTQAITNSIGHVVAFNLMPAVGSYYFNTFLSNGGDSHYLNGLWCDGAVAGWNFVNEGDGYYSINDGTNKLTAGAAGELITLTSGTGDDTKWKLLTEAEWKAENVARLDAATPSNGVDATFYIPAANFGRNDNDENAKWQGNPTLGGVATNYNAQKFFDTYATFDVYQALTGLKPGAYKLTVQGFYRNGLDNASDANDNLAILYANSSEVALKNISYYGYTDDSHSAEGFTTAKSGIYVPDSQDDATNAFDAGNFENELYVLVGEDGNLRVGVKKDAATGADKDWAVFDNFQLTYYGNSVFATIGSTGWTTFASAYPLDLSNMTASTGSVAAYYASAIGEEKVTMTSTESTGVAAGEGLMLKGTVGATIIIPVAASGTAISGNKLVGCTVGTTLEKNATSGYNNYVLVNNGGTAEFQSLAENGATIPAGKAYLQNGTYSAGARLSIVFDDATAIKDVDAAAKSGAQADGKYLEKGKIAIYKNGVKYNVAGQQMK